jgi:hypothetical protein
MESPDLSRIRPRILIVVSIMVAIFVAILLHAIFSKENALVVDLGPGTDAISVCTSDNPKHLTAKQIVNKWKTNSPKQESSPATPARVAAFDVTPVERACSWTGSGKEQRCTVLDITGSVENSCGIPLAVQIRINALDQKGIPFQTKEVWLNNRLPVAPGVSPFRLVGVLEYEPETQGWAIEVIKVESTSHHLRQ